MENRIITNTEKSINETLEAGQVIINGGSRIFEITNLTDNEVELTAINGDSENKKKSVMSRKVFCQLFYRKNYNQVSSADKARTEHFQSAAIGSNRFMLK